MFLKLLCKKWKIIYSLGLLKWISWRHWLENKDFNIKYHCFQNVYVKNVWWYKIYDNFSKLVAENDPTIKILANKIMNLKHLSEKVWLYRIYSNFIKLIG